MNRTLTSLLALTLFIGCGEAALTGEQELLLSTTSGEEEPAAFGDKSTEAYGTPSLIDQPEMFRECNSQGFFKALFDGYDADRSGELGRDEEADIHHARSGREDHHVRMMQRRWHFLSFVYDANDDGEISESERTTLLSDHTERCENLHAQVLADFDEDGDGLLSDAEKEAAHDAMQERHEDHRENMKEAHGRHKRGDRDRSEVPPPVLEEFDSNNDGELSSNERKQAREALRARLASGQPLCNEADD